MTLATILAFCGILSFLALRSAFFGLKLMAGMSWFVLWMFLKDNPPDVIIEGSGTHTALLVVIVGFGLMIVLSGLGRGIAKSQKRMNAGFEVTQQVEGFQWKLPDWLKAGQDEPENRTRNVNNALDDYRETLRGAYRTNQKRR